jgi:hypothetical protein
MRESGARQAQVKLRHLVAEATRALAVLDAERLEELALSCQALTRDLETADPAEQNEIVRQAAVAKGDIAVFARILDATRANLAVLNGIRRLRRGRPLEYHAPLGSGGGYGDH